MSFTDGMAALTLQTPPRVPRTEYSVEMHYDLVAAVTGMRIGEQTPWPERHNAYLALHRAWQIDLLWNIMISSAEFGTYRTDMGHAVYADKGADYRPVGKTLFDDPDKVLAFDPADTFGIPGHDALVKRFDAHYRASVDGWPNEVHMTGIYVTLISGLIDLLGWDMLLLTAGVNPAGFGDLANRYARWMQHYFDALAESIAPVVMIHDDIVWTAGAFIHPDWYRQYVFPNFKRYFQPLRDAGKIVLFTSDGNYTEFLDDVVAAGANGLVFEPLTDMACFASKYGKTHSFIGNADTRVLLSGSKQRIRTEVERCMAIGKKCPGFFMAVGNHIPPNTPVESALYYNQCYQELSKR